MNLIHNGTVLLLLRLLQILKEMVDGKKYNGGS
jgi:hypothetical protein